MNVLIGVLVALMVFVWQDGSKSVFNGKPSSVTRDTLLKPHKVPRGPTKKIAWNHGRMPSSKDKILELLHDFVNQFLTGGYNGIFNFEFKTMVCVHLVCTLLLLFFLPL